jgi:hypothetical protein
VAGAWAAGDVILFGHKRHRLIHVQSAEYVVTKLESETREDGEGNKTAVDWHSVKLKSHDSEIFVCTDPANGELVCAEYGLREEAGANHKSILKRTGRMGARVWLSPSKIKPAETSSPHRNLFFGAD